MILVGMKKGSDFAGGHDTRISRISFLRGTRLTYLRNGIVLSSPASPDIDISSELVIDRRENRVEKPSTVVVMTLSTELVSLSYKKVLRLVCDVLVDGPKT